MALTEKYIEKVRVGGTTADFDHIIAAKYISATTTNSPDAGYKTWKDITDLVEASFDINVVWTATQYAATTTPSAVDLAKVPYGITVHYKSGASSATGTLTASASTKNTLYLIYEKNSFYEYATTYNGSTYGWEKIGSTDIDLSNYALKGTYTSSTPSTNATGSAGGQTATGAATVTYDKASNQTQSAGGATVNGSNFTFSGTKATLALTQDYQPAGTVSKPGVTLNLGSTVTYVSGVKATGGTANALTGVAADGTASVLTAAIKGVSLSASETSTDGPAYISAVSGTFNTGAIKSASLDVKDTSTTGYQAVVTAQGTFSGGSATGTFNTDAIKAIGGTRNYGFSASTSRVMTAPTVSGGVLSWTEVAASTQDAHTGTAAATASVSYTAPSLGAATTKYIKVATTAAGTASVSATTNYMKVSTTAADAKATVLTGVKANGTATVVLSTGLSTATFNNYTSAALASTPTFTGTTATLSLSAEYTPAGSIGGSQTISGHTHGITLTATTITGTAEVAVASHTHSLGNHTHSTTI